MTLSGGNEQSKKAWQWQVSRFADTEREERLSLLNSTSYITHLMLFMSNPAVVHPKVLLFLKCARKM